MLDVRRTLTAPGRGVDPAQPANPSSVVVALAGRRDLWRPQVEFRHPRHYVRLLAGEGWEAWLLTWLPGQATGLHDHGGSAGAFGVVEGVLAETLPVPEQGRLTLRTSRYPVGAVRSFGERHLHDVRAVQAPAVSIHVYAPALMAMTRYTLDDGVLTAVVHERVGADW